jgi:hypothetical protein
VSAGEAEITSPTKAFSVEPEHWAQVRGTDRASYDAGPAHGSDFFDEFCRARDRREDRAESAKYVAANVIGSSDLDDSGIWLTDRCRVACLHGVSRLRSIKRRLRVHATSIVPGSILDICLGESAFRTQQRRR